ncbi:MAG: CAP domain-containing protein [Planctomycetota bacterium]|jgi:uncharacterized protein YkwD
MGRLTVRLVVVACIVVLTDGLAYAAGATAQARPGPQRQHAAAVAAEERPPAKLTIEQRRELGRLIAKFRRAQNDPTRRAQCVEEAIEYGWPAVSALLELIAREIHPQLQRYRNLFSQQTAVFSAERIRKASPAEIAQLRSTVLGLSKEPNLTKETIIARSDPAVKRLEGVFLVDRSEVLQRSEKLRREREKLQLPGRLWQRCAVHLYNSLPHDNRPKRPPSFERYLRGEEQMAARLAVPMDPRTRTVMAGNARIASRLDPEEARSILALNLTRNLLGLPPLVIDRKLIAAARDHSKDMQRLEFFSHVSPLPGKESCRDRAKRFGTTASTENIFRGSPDGKAANLVWFHSPGHHKNMLGNHQRVGVGRAGSYFTQMFGR